MTQTAQTAQTREALVDVMLTAMSEFHSGNFAEAQRIVDAQIAALEAAGVRLDALAALSAPAPSGLTDEGLGLAHQTPMQDVEIEYWLNQADNYAEVSIPCDDLRSLIARAISPAPSIDWKRVEEVRKRADELERLGHLAYHDWASEAHADRAFLLSLLAPTPTA